MNKKDADKWCKALRSGKYKQGKKILYCEVSNTHCCLGVLNKIMPDKYPGGCYGIKSGETNHFKSDVGFYDTKKRTESLAWDNDNGKTFPEIADIIEEHYKQL